MNAIISIHDVMPSTLANVTQIIERLPQTCRQHLILLIVPGLDWESEQMAELRRWQQSGIRLAGHGWTHEAREINGWYHRLHSLLLSRRAAEHLSLSADEIEALMLRNHAWFESNCFDMPNFYVPPAWALGKINFERLQASPWRYLETMSRLVDLETGHARWLPLVGFEADTVLRRVVLSVINRLSEWIASDNRPLRISIHPFDYEYLMADQLEATIRRVEQSLPIEAAFG